MSDYEGEDWQPIDLVSYGRSPDVARNQSQNFLGVPKGPAFHSKSGHGKRPQKPPRRLNEALKPHLQHIEAGGSSRKYKSSGKLARSNEQEITTLPSFQRFEARKGDPDLIYELSVTWQTFIKDLPAVDIRPDEVFFNRLARIRDMTGAWIQPTDDDTNQICLWGTAEQCDLGHELLRALELDVRGPGFKEFPRGWEKTQAYDGRREHRIMRADVAQLQQHSFQNMDDADFDFEAYLIWPRGYDLTYFIDSYSPSTLQAIEQMLQCRFTHDTTRHSTKVQATTESELLGAYQRLVNLAKEMMASKARGTHVTLFELPTPDKYSDKVAYAATADGTWTYFLTGKALPGDDVETWSRMRKNVHKDNARELATHLDSFVKSFYASASHVKLRVRFGEFRLDKFQRPPGGSDNYDVKDFFKMVANERTQLTDCILDGKGDMSQLAERIEALEEFTCPVQAWEVYFDFTSEKKNARLRLVVEFEPGYDGPERAARRWLMSKGQPSASALDLKVLDLEGLGHSFRVEAYDLFHADAPSREMQAFSSTINLKPYGLGSGPGRRAIYPQSRTDLLSVTEVTIKRFQFKATAGTFELRREDTFDERRSSGIPIHTRWAASYYYQEWDALMAEFANIKAGEEVKWQQKLSTFFPETSDLDNPKSLPVGGFRTFTREIQEIKGHLNRAMNDLPVSNLDKVLKSPSRMRG